MEKTFKKIKDGYQQFREKYVKADQSLMKLLSYRGQQPEIMVVACCDSRVDPAVILQCDPGDLFVIRNVATVIPPYEKDEAYHGTSAALEFGICFLKVKHLILLGHSQCGGLQLLLKDNVKNDFISKWVSIIPKEKDKTLPIDEYAKASLKESYKNSLTFPWIKDKYDAKKLQIHLWYFDIEHGEILNYSFQENAYQPLI